MSLEEDATSALLPFDVAIAPRPPRRSRLRRMDVALVAVLVSVACFIYARPPSVRTTNPLLLATPSRNFGYLTYDDIPAIKRQSGYSVTVSSRGFAIDGTPTLLLGGSIHYPRSSIGQWEQLLRAAKQDGLNFVEMCRTHFCHVFVCVLWCGLHHCLHQKQDAPDMDSVD